MKEGQTSPPILLTEAGLIGQMEKAKIGTDATIHEHINTIKNRNYIFETHTRHLEPTDLGKSLIEGYLQMGIQ